MFWAPSTIRDQILCPRDSELMFEHKVRLDVKFGIPRERDSVNALSAQYDSRVISNFEKLDQKS